MRRTLPIVSGLVVALACVAITPARPAPAAEPGSVRIVEPRPRTTVLGRTTVEVELVAPARATPVRLELLVDGDVVDARTAPPWTFEWDAGDGSRGHTLSARATFSDGSVETASVRTTRLRINAVEEVDLVNLYVVVRDERGRFVEDLDADDFTLLEDGRPQTIKVFTAEPKPLAVAIVLDTSTTMEGAKIAAARESAVAFLRALTPADRAMVLGFSDDVRMLHELTDDTAALRASIESTDARGGTALYDAIWKGADGLCREDARRVVVLLSDGRDEASNGLEPGSLHTLQEALDQTLRCETMVFAIGFGRTSDLEQLDFHQRFTQAEILRRFGAETGGGVLFPRRTGTLRRAFEEIADRLRHQYAIAYSSDDDRRDGAWREISLTVDRPGVEIVTRRGYYASPPES